MAPSQVNQDPVQGEFFTATADMAERLVRESIQNSLDARAGEDPVRVRFAFSGADQAIGTDAAVRYLRGLEPHLESITEAATDLSANDGGQELEALGHAWDQFEQPLKYLLIEDFGTAGLRGDICANGKQERDNDFWGFFRSIGISIKREDAGGSWGLGKWVFPDVSTLNAYFGLTKRHGEEESFLMGMAMLRTHTINQHKYPPYGFFAAHSDSIDACWFPMPVTSSGTDAALLEQFRHDFGVTRTQEPGLSVVIPHPADTLKPDDIVAAVITQYFLSVVRGDLEVEVEHPKTPATKIDAFSIERLADRMITPKASDRSTETPESVRRIIQMAQWAVQQTAHTPIVFPISKLRESIQELDVPDLRSRYEQGDRLAFRLETDVTRKEGSPCSASFDVYLEKNDELSEGRSYFVRGHVRVPISLDLRRLHARVLVSVGSDSEFGFLLRDAEGPAHASWNPHAKRLKERWSGGYQRVQAVRRAAKLLLEHLVERPCKPQYDALADLFPDRPDATGGGGHQPAPGSPGTPMLPPVLPLGLPLRVARKDGCLRIHPSRQAANRLTGAAIRLRFAYDVMRGGRSKAFRLFEQGARQGCPDFTLLSTGDLAGGALKMVATGAEVTILTENALLLRADDCSFELTVDGFDDRDVIVEAQSENGLPEEEATS